MIRHIILFGMVICAAFHSANCNDDELESLKRRVAQLEQLVQQSFRLRAGLPQASSAIGFSAYMQADTVVSDGTLALFDTVLTNLGDVYSVNSGTFQAPVNGLYSFTLYHQTNGDYNVDLQLRVDGNMYCKSDATSSWNTGTCSMMAELNAGDEVNVMVDAAPFPSGFVRGGGYSGFTGHLVAAL